MVFGLISGGLVIVTSVAGIYDLRTQTVPNWLTLPPLGVALSWRVGQSVWGTQPHGLLIWSWLGFLVIQAGWYAGGYGGADAKLFGALWLLWPTLLWLSLWLASLVLGYAAQRIASQERRPLPALGPGAMATWLYIVTLFIADVPVLLLGGLL